jgi:hypothetical protein
VDEELLRLLKASTSTPSWSGEATEIVKTNIKDGLQALISLKSSSTAKNWQLIESQLDYLKDYTAELVAILLFLQVGRSRPRKRRRLQ